MLINSDYTDGLSPEETKVTELVLFCIDREINLNTFLTVEDGLLVTKEMYDQVINEVVTKLYKKGLLVTDYSLQDQRLKLARPLFVSHKVEDGELSVVRDFFTAQYCGQEGKAGDARIVLPKLKAFMEEHGLELSVVREATELYIQSCIDNGRFIKDFTNYIDSDKGSTLLQFIEVVQSRKRYDVSKFI